MTMRLIPHSIALSEFVSGYNGDCGETAELALLHVVNPTAYPFTAAMLDTIVKRDIAHGWASSNGSEPLSAIANDLAALGIAHTNYGYAEPYTADWRGMLTTWGGIKPIIFEYARASALPGDESGVAYHFNTCLGWDTATNAGLFADGDNYVERTGGTALVTYTETDLVNAGLCGMLVGEYTLGGAMTTVPTGWRDDGTTLTAPNGLTVGTGFRAWILAHAWDATDQPVGPETHVSEVEYCNTAHGAGTIQYFQQSQLTWTSAGGVWATRTGLEAHALRAALDTALTAEAQAQAQAQKDAAIIGAQSGQIATLTAQVASLKAQLATAKSAPPPVAVNPAPTTPAAAAALLVSLIYAEADATLKAAASGAPAAG